MNTQRIKELLQEIEEIQAPDVKSKFIVGRWYVYIDTKPMTHLFKVLKVENGVVTYRSIGVTLENTEFQDGRHNIFSKDSVIGKESELLTDIDAVNLIKGMIKEELNN